MGDSDETRVKLVTLVDHSNFSAWHRSIINALRLKDYSSVIGTLSIPPASSDVEEYKVWAILDAKAWSLIDTTLSERVHDNLPSHLADYDNTDTTKKSAASQLLDWLVSKYSDSEGPQLATLYRTIWCSFLEDNTPPNDHLAKLRSAQIALTKSGKQLTEKMFCYAILDSLLSNKSRNA